MITIYIALLRGINVGGHNRIKMAELKTMFETMGLGRVKTYIQSGNVLFESNEREELLRMSIEHEIKQVFGFPVTVILRTAAELVRIIENSPFSDEEVAEAKVSSEGESLHVALLLEAPSKEGIERLSIIRSESDKYQIEGRDIYLLFRQGVRNSKLAKNLQKLDVPATMRNWKTLNKLTELAKEMGVGS
jgi:uncharacterized protein (DUF1697 family)